MPTTTERHDCNRGCGRSFDSEFSLSQHLRDYHDVPWDRTPAGSGEPDKPISTDSCKFCGETILWAKSEKGNWTPLDFRRAEDGTFELEGGTAYYVPAEYRDVPLYRFHGLSCPG